MRASEFLFEYNPFDKGTFIERPILNDKYILRGRAKERLDGSTVFLVTVYDPKNPKDAGEMAKEFGMDGIAGFRFVKRKDGSVASADTFVDKEYQRQGIASTVYKFVKSLGFDVQPSPMQSPQGKAMWQGFRDKGVVEGGADTSWSDGDEKITLQDILELAKHIKQINLPIDDNLKSKLIHWDGNPEEIERINQVTVSNQFPILVMLDGQGQIDWILDGNHRLHKAIKSQAKTIPAKLIKPSDLNDKAKRVFHIKEQDVNEAPLPPDWDKEKLNLRQTYKNRIKYALERAKRLGGGSSRVAMIIDYEGRPTVLKVAKNYKGLKQNQAELDILDDGYLGNLPIVIPLIDYDKENNQPVWIQTEVAKKITAPTLMKMLHTPSMWLFTNKVRNILGRRKPLEMDDVTIKRKYFETHNERWKPTEQDWDIFEEYANEVADLVGNSSLELGDLGAASNWGVYNGRPVIIDLGLSEEVWKKYYLAGKYGRNRPR